MPESFKRRWKNFYSDQLEREQSITFDHLLDHIDQFMKRNSIPLFRKEPQRGKTRVLRTDADTKEVATPKPKKTCTIHLDCKNHNLVDCVVFKKMPYEERRIHAVENKLCFNCLQSHLSTAFHAKIVRKNCSGRHLTIMHRDRRP